MKALIGSVHGVTTIRDDATIWNFAEFQDHIPNGSIKECNYFEFTRHKDGIQMQNKKFIRSPEWSGVGPKKSRDRPTSSIIIKVNYESFLLF